MPWRDEREWEGRSSCPHARARRLCSHCPPQTTLSLSLERFPSWRSRWGVSACSCIQIEADHGTLITEAAYFERNASGKLLLCCDGRVETPSDATIIGWLVGSGNMTPKIAKNCDSVQVYSSSPQDFFITSAYVFEEYSYSHTLGNEHPQPHQGFH